MRDPYAGQFASPQLQAETFCPAITMAGTPTTTKPDTSIGTLKREELFRNPPKDKSAFPALLAAVEPHIASFNAITEDHGLLDLARKDIGVKTVVLKKGEEDGINKVSCM